MGKNQPASSHHPLRHRQWPLPSPRLGWHHRIINRRHITTVVISLKRQEWTARPLENDHQQRLDPLVHNLQLPRDRSGRQDLPTFPRNALKIPSTLLLPIQQQTHLHTNRLPRHLQKQRQRPRTLLHILHRNRWKVNQYRTLLKPSRTQHRSLGRRSHWTMENQPARTLCQR